MSKAPAPTSAPTLQTLAAGLGLTIRRVSQLKTLGMDCSSLASAQEWRKRKSASGEISVDELRKARFHLIEEQRRKIEIENSVRRREFVPAGQAEEFGAAVGFVMKSMLLRMANDLPPTLEGLTAVTIGVKLREASDKILATFADELRRFATVTQNPDQK